MTTGHEGHGTDCTEALLRLYEFLDGEIGPEDGAKIQAHLDECERCLRQYRMDQALKELVRRILGD
jgi:anti-sigma factor (TIGR02949 family)